MPPRLAKLVLEKPGAAASAAGGIAEARQCKPEPRQQVKPVKPQARMKPHAVSTARSRRARRPWWPACCRSPTTLADLRDNKAAAELGSNRALTGAVGDGPRNERSLITSKAGRGSGGINTAA